MVDVFVQVFSNLRANKLRSFLTMFGILWGVMSVVILSATGEGFRLGNQAVLEELVRLSRVAVEVVVDPDRYHALDAPLIFGDPTRLKTDTGWSPRYSLRDTLRDLLDDWRSRI